MNLTHEFELEKYNLMIFWKIFDTKCIISFDIVQRFPRLENTG